MQRLKNNNITKIFTELIKKPKHKYPTKFSRNSYTTKSFSLSNMKYYISVWGPKLWNDFSQNKEKEIQSYTFKKNCKVKVNWNRKWSYVLLLLSFKISVFNSYSLNTDQSKS